MSLLPITETATSVAKPELEACMKTLVHLESRDDIALIVIDNPPVNALSLPVRVQLLQALKKVKEDDRIKALVIACEGTTFVAGADIKEFDQPLHAPHLPEVMVALESSAKPVVAAMHGSVLGGGLELALACHYRVARHGCTFGLPEVTLGLIPGSGGTQRLARLCGPILAAEMIVGGKILDCAQASESSLLDQQASDDVRGAALALAAQAIMTGNLPNIRNHQIPAYDRQAFDTVCQSLVRKKRGELAPMLAVHAIEAGLQHSFEEGLAVERTSFLQLRGTEQSKALRQVFFAERGLKSRVRSLTREHAMARIEAVAVIGAGTMGSGIAICLANAGLQVMLIDTQAAALERGLTTVNQHYATSAAKGRMTAEQSRLCAARITGADSLDAAAQVDLVIEAVFEDIEVKRSVFEKLDRLLKPGAIMATNTSYLDVEVIAHFTQRPDYVLGMHFFSPAQVMKLIEVVKTRDTRPEVLASVMALGRQLEKIAIPVGVCDGFVGNRLLAAREREANFLLEEGATPQDVDSVIRAFGFPMGPFELRDLSGVDVAWRNRQGRLRSLTAREARCNWVDRLYASGRLGQKSGAGYYRYDPDSRKPMTDGWMQALLEQHADEHGIERRKISDQEIEERCLFSMINEAAWLMNNDIVEQAADIDLIWIHGYGFPRFKGGLTYYADQLGLPSIAESLRDYRRHASGEPGAPLHLDAFLAHRTAFHQS